MRNFEKMAKRSNHKAMDFEVTKGRKFNKVKRDRSHKRIWEGL
ncbi:conserved hypothetical phage protein [Salmonella phage Vi06]|uniref:Conserved hypothetical phage protein n=1 Tax=Salmonella phage Vi06 TaxID=866889 RepID=E1XU84_9CAUD|nr:hypothetical protein Vi06_05 [Salmonella phage Vi06]CBV65203.1 conserved hypothetical phage protein [Salmonella phage Vi06]